MTVPKVWSEFDAVTVEQIDARIPIPLGRFPDAEWLVGSNIYHRLEAVEQTIAEQGEQIADLTQRLARMEEQEVEWS